MKKILGLDLGTNSIGWALVEICRTTNSVTIKGLGSRIIPMDAGEIKKYKEGGIIESAAAQRTDKRGARKNNQRFILRRDRLHMVLNLLKALPEHYKINIHLNEDQPIESRKDNKGGQFKNGKESKLAYKPKEKGKKAEFLFMESYLEMLSDINSTHATNKKKNRIPYDWTLYYLRQKALKEKISLEEFAWVLLSYNQKRGYQKTEANSEESELTERLKSFGLTKEAQKYIDTNKLEIESFPLKVKSATKLENEDSYRIELENGFVYKEYSSRVLTTVKDGIDEVKMVERISFLNSENEIDESKTIIKIQDIYTLKIEDITIEQKDKKTQHTFIYDNGWTRSFDKNNPIKGIKKNIGKDVDVIATSFYDTNGKRIKPSIKKSTKENEEKQLILNLDKEYENPYKMEIATKDTDWQLLKIKTEKETLKYNAEQGFISDKGVRKYISPKIYDTLKSDAKEGHFHRTKIIGGKFQTIERDFYREELKQIIETQRREHKGVFEDETIIESCVRMLYPKNKAHAEALRKNKDTLTQLLVEDVLLYHRPLKSKKSEIADCKFEIRHIKDGKKHYHKVITVSHPLFQEFRIWDKIHNLKLIQIEKNDEISKKSTTNVDITNELFTTAFYQKLFDKFNSKNTITRSNFIDLCFRELKLKDDKSNYTWNYPDDEEFKGNQTKTSFKTRFGKAGIKTQEYELLMTNEKETKLWHYLYSVPYNERVKKGKNNKENESLYNFFLKLFKNDNLEDDIILELTKSFAKYPKFESRYGAYSEKSLKKLLPFLRIGDFKGSFDLSGFEKELEAIKYDANNINTYLGSTKENLEKLDKIDKRNLETKKQALYKALWQHSINQRIHEILERKDKLEIDEDGKTIYDNAIDLNAKIPYPKGLFNAFRDFEKPSDFTKFNLTQASYLVYGRHSELAEAKRWTSPDMIREELQNELKQNSLNNPIAEKVIREMMQVVADIWEYYGDFKTEGDEKIYNKLFDEIHIEVARELKKNAKQKKNAASRNTDNRKQNKRLRQVLSEFLSQAPYNAEPSSKNHFEKLKILEESALQIHQYTKKEDRTEGIEEVLKADKITKAMFDKYKLWIEQGYMSPYSGNPIMLSELFDGDKYDIDHIFPQALITNDSLSNKVVCEKVLNGKKSNLTGRAFIQKFAGKTFELEEGKKDPQLVTVCDEDVYLAIVNKQFSGTKKYILNSLTIPKGFTDSRLNTTKHIARKAMELLSHIVRDEGEVEYRSKHVLPVTGIVTDKLKRAWQLNHVWSKLMEPRFKRMNALTNSELFGRYKKTKQGEEYFECKLDDKLLELNPDFEIKRIDHRHHALDALIVAFCTKEHVQYINNVNAGNNQKEYGKHKSLEAYRLNLKRKIKWSEPKKEKPDENNWRFMQPGEYRIKPDDNYSREDTVQKMDFIYKGKDGIEIVSNTDSYGHKPIIFEVLNDVITSFKQKKSVIRKSSNKFWSYKNDDGSLNLDSLGNPLKRKRKQLDSSHDTIKNNNKRNTAIRVSMHDENPYGKTYYPFENLELIKNIENRERLANEELKVKLEDLFHNCNENLSDFITAVKNGQKEKFLPEKAFFKLAEFKAKYTIRKALSGLNLKQVQKIADPKLYSDLLAHINKYDSLTDALSETGVESFNESRKVPVTNVKLVNDGSGRYVLGDTPAKHRQNKQMKGSQVHFEILNKDDKKEFSTLSLNSFLNSSSNFDKENIVKINAGDTIIFLDSKDKSEFSLDNLYVFNNSSGVTANFVPVNIAYPIWDYGFPNKNNEEKELFNFLTKENDFLNEKGKPIKNELGLGSKQNKLTVEFITSELKDEILDGKSIKDNCKKININRLGKIRNIKK